MNFFLSLMGEIMFCLQSVQKVDRAIHRRNHYPVDKCKGNHLRYQVDRNLSGGYIYVLGRCGK